MRSTIERDRQSYLKQLSSISKGQTNLSKHLMQALEFLFNSGDYYNRATAIQKLRMISSIFPENLIYDGEKVRTPRVNEVLRLMTLITNGKRSNKKGQLFKKIELSSWVEPTGQSSNFLEKDLDSLLKLCVEYK